MKKSVCFTLAFILCLFLLSLNAFADYSGPMGEVSGVLEDDGELSETVKMLGEQEAVPGKEEEPRENE